MWISGQDNMLLMGWDNMRLPGLDNKRLPGWDKMGWDETGHDKMCMTCQDRTMKRNLRKMILYMTIMCQKCCDGCLLRKYQIH